MSDNYQAVYDAVRSRITGCDVGSIVEEAARNGFDASRMMQIIQQEFSNAAYEMARPSAIFRPTLSKDGSKWCALYGENLAEGFAVFADTPEAAMRAFDNNWGKP